MTEKNYILHDKLLHEAHLEKNLILANVSREYARIYSYQDYISSLAPANQPTSLTFSNVLATSMDVSWTASVGGADGYVVFRRTGASPTFVPVDATEYVVDTVYGDSTCEFFGSGVTFSETGLTASTTYYYDVFAFNGTTGTYAYLTTSPLENSQATASSFAFDNALHFDGSNDVVTGNVNSALAGSATMVMEFWFKADGATFATNAQLVHNFNTTPNQGFGISGLTGTKTITFDIFNGSITRGLFTITTLNIWNHVRLEYDGALSGDANRLKAKVNGSYITMDSFVGTIPATIGTSGQPIRLGRFASAVNFFDGWLDEICIWSDSVGSDTYNGGAGASPTATNLIRHLKLNEVNSSTDAHDETGNETFTLTNFNYDANSGFGAH